SCLLFAERRSAKEDSVRSLTRSWRRSVVVVGVGVLAASVIPATGQAQNVGDEADPPIDEWPATDIFHDSEFDSDAARDARRLEDGGVSTFSTLAEPDEIVVEDGVTQPVFDYAGAVREAVRIPGAVSSEEGDEI